MSKFVLQRFTGGMNQDMSPALLDLRTQGDIVLDVISTCSNMVFERGVIKTRQPFLEPVSVPAKFAGTTLIRAIEAFAFEGSPTGTAQASACLAAIVTAAGPVNKLFKMCTDLGTAAYMTPIEITGPGLADLSDYFFSKTVVNGVVIIGGCINTLIRWDPSTTVYTRMVVAGHRFVTHQFSRCIAAYKLSGAITDPLTISYSGTSETDWTSLSAGTVILPDVSDAISGMAVAKGLVVVARTRGFHLGVPTGLFPNLYNWQLYSEESVGVAYPATFKLYKNIAFFMSNSGIHSFDTVNVVDIGEGVYKEIFNLIQTYGLVPRAFVACSYTTDYQPTYNIVLDAEISTQINTEIVIPHYMYNINENKWSRHFYKSTADNVLTNGTPLAFATVLPSTQSSISGTWSQAQQPVMGVVNRAVGVVPTFRLTNAAIPGAVGKTIEFLGGIQQVVSFATAMWSISPPNIDATINRVLLVYNNLNVGAGQPATITVQVNSILNGVVQNNTVVSVLTQAPATTDLWERQWVNLRATGQMFQIIVTVTATAAVACAVQFKELLFEFDDVAVERA